MNSSCPMDAFDQGPSHIPCAIQKSNSYIQTTVFKVIIKSHPIYKHNTYLSNGVVSQSQRTKLFIRTEFSLMKVALQCPKPEWVFLASILILLLFTVLRQKWLKNRRQLYQHWSATLLSTESHPRTWEVCFCCPSKIFLLWWRGSCHKISGK